MSILIFLGIGFFVVGIAGMGVILYKKAPILLAENVSFVEPKEEDILRQKITTLTKSLKDRISFESFLKKSLTRIKIRLLKWENKIDQYLQKLSYSKKFDKDFWDKFQNNKKE